MPDASPYNSHLACHTALVLARLLREHGVPGDGGWPVTELLRTVAVVAKEHKLGVTGSRHVAARQHIACYAAVYARRFCPPAGWTLTSVHDPDAAPVTGLLHWAAPDGSTVLDVLSCENATSPVLTGDGRDLLQIARSGVQVRILRLAAPHTSVTWRDGRWEPLGCTAAVPVPATPTSAATYLPAGAVRAAS